MNEILEVTKETRTLEDAAKHYERSEITVVFIHDKTTGSFTNVFSVAEMCPYEQEKSEEVWDVDSEGNKVFLKRLNLDKNRSIYITRYFSNDPADSISFYRGQANKRTVKIGKDERVISSAGNNLAEDPLNEVAVLIPSFMHHETSLGVVLPKRKVSMRVCSLIDVESVTVNSFTQGELLKINEFINKILGMNIIKYPEFFGAILLCFANPILRSSVKSLAKTENQIIIQLFERKGKSIFGGMIEVSDERINGKGFVLIQKISKPRFVMDIPCPPEKVRVRIFQKDGTLIEDVASHFIRNIEVQFAVTEARRKITITDKNNDTNTFEVDTVSYMDTKRKENMTVQKLLSEKERYRELDLLEEKRIFIYFPGNQPESKKYAQKIIRELLGRAKERCTICDPYLSGNEVVEYALFVKTTNVKVELLTSASYLLNKKTGKANKTYGEELKETIASLIRQDHTLEIKCHVLCGRDKSPLHDRFLIIDDSVYLLGSSLNEFGSRATTLFKSPDPRPLIRQADIWINDERYSMPIDIWLQNRNIEDVIDKC